MILLIKDEYDKVEELLRVYGLCAEMNKPYESAMSEIITFFNNKLYKKFIEIFYFNRHKYKNRYPDNRSLFNYLSEVLYVQESTLYLMRKEIVYKSAMIFYKYDVL